jgi:4-diphosphocytidyl-2-C-methyl-D-erythritol kinase
LKETLPAPAKINLALHVTGRRDDGYHLLDTLVVFTEDGDRLSISSAERDTFSVSGAFAQAVPLDASNLVLRARDLLRAHFPEAARRPVSIVLEKNLPPASGIGGGSSDAAAALKALVRLWDIPITEADLARHALPLGADLPMCLAARPLVAKGIGEEIAPA